MAAALAKPEPLPLGAVKTFGPWGPMYEVLAPAPNAAKGRMVHIRVLFSGEELDYPMADMLSDPFKA